MADPIDVFDPTTGTFVKKVMDPKTGAWVNATPPQSSTGPQPSFNPGVSTPQNNRGALGSPENSLINSQRPTNPGGVYPGAQPFNNGVRGVPANQAGPMGGGSLSEIFQQGFSSLPYYNTAAFQDLLKGYTSDPGRTLIDQGNIQKWQGIIKGYGDTFASQFKNLAGRDPTADEYNTFFQQVVNPLQPYNKTPDQSQIQQASQGLIKDAFSNTIQDSVTQKAQTQANAAVQTNSPFDDWQKSYMNSINDTEKSLTDYQSKLFEKLRPQLLTSLQAQGLLNSGALNTAFAGAAEDLATGSSNFIANARQQAAQDIANTKYAITSSPTNAALTNTFNTIPNLTQNGQNALQNVFNQDSSMNLANLGYQNQLGLMNAQNQNQPSLLSQYGGLILGGIAGGAGRKIGGMV